MKNFKHTMHQVFNLRQQGTNNTGYTRYLLVSGRSSTIETWNGVSTWRDSYVNLDLQYNNCIMQVLVQNLKLRQLNMLICIQALDLHVRMKVISMLN